MPLSPQDYWRAIVLYGTNVATYKIALAHCLMDFAVHGKTHMTINDLAQAFFHAYRQRLAKACPNRPIQHARPFWSGWWKRISTENSPKQLPLKG